MSIIRRRDSQGGGDAKCRTRSGDGGGRRRDRRRRGDAARDGRRRYRSQKRWIGRGDGRLRVRRGGGGRRRVRPRPRLRARPAPARRRSRTTRQAGRILERGRRGPFPCFRGVCVVCNILWVGKREGERERER